MVIKMSFVRTIVIYRCVLAMTSKYLYFYINKKEKPFLFVHIVQCLFWMTDSRLLTIESISFRWNNLHLLNLLPSISCSCWGDCTREDANNCHEFSYFFVSIIKQAHVNKLTHCGNASCFCFVFLSLTSSNAILPHALCFTLQHSCLERSLIYNGIMKTNKIIFCNPWNYFIKTI